jgi:hypothetical protein
METNVGKGFEVAIAAGDADGGATCTLFASSFGEDPAATESLLDTGDLKFDLYTVYRPVNLKEGEKYPILTWGNGTCAQPAGRLRPAAAVRRVARLLRGRGQLALGRR